MKKLVERVKTRYAEGLEWMFLGESLPQMMYIACTISGLLSFYKMEAVNASVCTIIVAINIILIYFLSYINNWTVMSSKRMRINFLTFWVLETILVIIMSIFVGFWRALGVFVIPIAIAYLAVFIEECTGTVEVFFETIKISNINKFCSVVIASLLPTIIIVISLISLEFNWITKITIVLGYIFCTPLISWADMNYYGIFGAMSFEW